jgi:hypothetical protein
MRFLGGGRSSKESRAVVADRLLTHAPELFDTKEEVQAKEQVRQSDLE